VPDKTWHLAKKEHNLDTRTYLESGTKYLDWEVVTLFYSAVHFVDAYLATVGTFGKHPTSHSQQNGRNDMVRRYLGIVEAEYMCLYRLSRGARYGPQSIQPEDVDDAEDWFNAVKYAVEPLTST
jgi:hypothetical protein